MYTYSRSEMTDLCRKEKQKDDLDDKRKVKKTDDTFENRDI